MASKKFASIMLNSTLWTEICSALPSFDSTITINVTNHNNTDIKISLAMTDLNPLSPNLEDIFLLEQIVFAKNSRQFPGVILPPLHKLTAKSDTNNVSLLVFGFEEDQ